MRSIQEFFSPLEIANFHSNLIFSLVLYKWCTVICHVLLRYFINADIPFHTCTCIWTQGSSYRHSCCFNSMTPQLSQCTGILNRQTEVTAVHRKIKLCATIMYLLLLLSMYLWPSQHSEHKKIKAFICFTVGSMSR